MIYKINECVHSAIFPIIASCIFNKHQKIYESEVQCNCSEQPLKRTRMTNTLITEPSKSQKSRALNAV